MENQDRQSQNEKTKATLEREELEAKISKLDKENANLDYQSSRTFRVQEWLKSIGGLAAVIAVVFSVFEWSGNSRHSLNARKEDRLSNALNNLADTSKSKRLVGIIALRSFIEKGEDLKNAQALLSLTHALAVENDPTVRNAILDLFRSKEVQRLDSGTLKNILQSLVILNRQLIKKEFKIKYYLTGEPLDVRMQSIVDKEEDMTTAILYFLGQNIVISDLSDLYLRNADFRGLSLSKINFSKATLAHSNFSNSKCIGCSFEDANLSDCSFVQSDLRNSSFKAFKNNTRVLIGGEAGNFLDNIFKHNRDADRFYFNIDFKNSDLRGTDFTNFPVIGYRIKYNKFTRSEDYFQSHVVFFDGTDLANADFSALNLSVIERCGAIKFPAIPFISADSSVWANQSKMYLVDFDLSKDSKLEKRRWTKNDSIMVKDIKATFHAVRRENTKFPGSIERILD